MLFRSLQATTLLLLKYLFIFELTVAITMSINYLGRLRNPLCHVLKNRIRHSFQITLPTPVTRCASDTSIPKNVIGHIYSASSQPNNGKVYDQKPFKIRLYPKKQYHWCLCGMSKSQPMCDGTHRIPHFKCKLKPIKFEVEEEKDYWLCNCKQTKLRPFCDGTHNTL